ncbi:hypothetical protein HRR80_002790 [Exophiala dermatitidis]|uniref:Uncharacterized protein n=2 Tax=Exophiala dermatitidis TaxID=5970 RepID=H6BZN0_EXODN|nr:uncharacterized protein HMPREF1120_05134 [Exophiala dermatitidis NIH/UT8656]KAJ4537325.1 hypothetical protein HRR76_005336 [Exophiala dermatitidis]EHY57084.1 hypothetical protein HMPREF1120_05134 [Exophiala dermatitidis NIH/UT8656]KAJ4555078.1 hypothetical protein HRR77_001022 [Exophiala dermatitidis]KAJ4566254.1 hypothetical protein HRR79_005269 [Exophiala dermatitidis]KAJ4571274.1 hypothetical protein HRR82_007273 [Exophiala dermatitidis]
MFNRLTSTLTLYRLYNTPMKMVATLSFLALGLIGASAATPSLRFAKRNSPNGCADGVPSQAAVAGAINQWNSDVTTVNDFLDVATSLQGLHLQLQLVVALRAANDEPDQLQILACASDVSPSTVAQAAADDLFTGFGPNVLTPLSNILNDPSSITQNLQLINQFRCCHVLPDLDTLWSFTAEDDGVANQVPLSAPRPAACASIYC